MRSFIANICLIICIIISISWISDIYIPINIKEAYDKETLSYDGKPGANYWQNRADYNIRVDFGFAIQQLLKTYQV